MVSDLRALDRERLATTGLTIGEYRAVVSLQTRVRDRLRNLSENFFLCAILARYVVEVERLGIQATVKDDLLFPLYNERLLLVIPGV